MRNIKVLVADDEATVRSFIKIVINKEQLPVASLAEANNGIEAVTLAKELKPDLIFLDIRMPGHDGLEAAAMILADDPQASIIIVSAYDAFDYARTAFRTGVADYLLKPVKPVDITAIVRKVAARCDPGEQPDVKPAVKRPALVKAVENYIIQNLDRPIQLRDIARAVFVSPYHLSRTFKHLTGQSLVDFVQERRLAKAGELLTATELSVTEVAGMVGFNDAAYFATCFKHKTGVSPIRYRKMQEIKNK